MPEMRKIDPREITENATRLIGDRWMLVTAGTRNAYNTMTANWGGLGFIWRKPAVFIFIRPSRYTYQFTEEQKLFTLSFMGEEYRRALAICGKLSGRDGNKMEKAGLTAFETMHGSMAIEGADLVLECRKMYGRVLDTSAFLDKAIPEHWYDDEWQVPHKMYIAEIVSAWAKE